jgi:hypothetical protein
MRRAWILWVTASNFLLWAALAFALDEVIVLPRANRGEVAFTHRAHAYDYDVGCDRCHHNITMVASDGATCRGCHLNEQHRGLCHDCHLSNRDRDFSGRYQTLQAELGKQKIPILFKAFHRLCRDCHTQVNQAEGRSAPAECGGCHK